VKLKIEWENRVCQMIFLKDRIAGFAQRARKAAVTSINNRIEG
jgi:hypothetical protein